MLLKKKSIFFFLLGIILVSVIGFVFISNKTPISPGNKKTTQTVAAKASVPYITKNPTLTPEPTRPVFPSGPVKVWVSPAIPQEIIGDFSKIPEILIIQLEKEADVRIDFGDEDAVSRYVFTLVAPFSTVTDGISMESLENLWHNGSSKDFSQLIVSGPTHFTLSNMWGKSSNQVSVVTQKNILATASNSPGTWAIVPFEDLEPKWKVIAVDGESPIGDNFDLQKYPLSIPISLYGPPEAKEWFLKRNSGGYDGSLVKPSNRDASKITTVMLTGVTALVRGTADMMELKGMTYPAQDIREILTNADVLHINNEVPFTPKCPPTAQRVSNQILVFCSKPEYIKLLEDIGTDIIELSGDHLIDWGPEAVLYTLQMYKDRNWAYYGGGFNIDDAKKPYLMEHNGNKIAFLGCNAKDKGYAGATATDPGAVTCDFDYLDINIRDLLSQGYLPIVTFQHEEIWRTDPPDTVKSDFYTVAKSGAIIASGSQSHQPQTFEFFEGSFLHFGLGNLFFDQVFEGDPYKRAFIDRHVIYNGKHISTELFTTIFIDLARSRLMTQEERNTLLEEVFIASNSTKQ